MTVEPRSNTLPETRRMSFMTPEVVRNTVSAQIMRAIVEKNLPERVRTSPELEPMRYTTAMFKHSAVLALRSRMGSPTRVRT